MGRPEQRAFDFQVFLDHLFRQLNRGGLALNVCEDGVDLRSCAEDLRLERDGRALIPTEKGLNVIRLLGEHALTSPDLTGSWERRLGRIERGEDSREDFMRDIAGFAKGVTHVGRGLAAVLSSLGEATPGAKKAPETKGMP